MSHHNNRSKPYVVLQSTTELLSLSAAWVAKNKARVYAVDFATAEAAAAPAPPLRGTPMHASQCATTSVCVRLQQQQQQLHASAPAGGAPRYQRPTHTAAAAAAVSARSLAGAAHPCQTPPDVAMAAIETDIIMAVSNRFLCEQPPYSGRQAHAVGVGSLSHRDNDLVAHASTVHITRDSPAAPLELAIPVAPPSAQQIASCCASPSYNKNVLMTMAAALTSDSLDVTIGASPSPAAAAISSAAPASAAAANTLYLSADVVPRSMGCTQTCEQALFGAARTTASANFELVGDLAGTYAGAVQKYQKYSNVALGEHITLVPSFHNRTPLVVSLQCPQLDVAHVATATSGSRNHPKFGPNHTTRIVELMGHLAPFVKACCEKYMALTPDTQQEVHEDNSIPVATCKAVDHAFSHDALNGVSTYVATHTFALPVAMLNSYAIEGGGATGQRAPFPVQHDIVVHTAAIFGGAASTRRTV
jgi:hypothetical protein